MHYAKHLNHNNTQKKLALWGVRLVSIAAVIFAGTRLVGLIHAPKISVNIDDGAVLSNSKISLNGYGKHIEQVFIGGVPTTISPDGKFTSDVVLNSGVNHITLSAIDKFGKQTLETYTLVLHEKTISVPLAANLSLIHI